MSSKPSSADLHPRFPGFVTSSAYLRLPTRVLEGRSTAHPRDPVVRFNSFGPLQPAQTGYLPRSRPTSPPAFRHGGWLRCGQGSPGPTGETPATPVDETGSWAADASCRCACPLRHEDAWDVAAHHHTRGSTHAPIQTARLQSPPAVALWALDVHHSQPCIPRAAAEEDETAWSDCDHGPLSACP